jgi:polyvinyl alcohol dehydrogenase (cytochrome)
MKTILGITIVSLAVLFSEPSHLSAQQQAAPAASQQQPSSPTAPRGDTEGAGSTIFGNYCESCHGKVEAAPAPAILKKMSPEHIYIVLSQGDMAPMAKDLTDKQKRDIAEWVGGRKLGATDTGDASKMSNVCSIKPPFGDVSSGPSWNGWSPGLSTTRFQPASDADMSAAKVARLKLKWAFGLPAADSVYGQPTIVDGRVYVTSDAGYVYSLDAKTGCVYWSFLAGTGIRSAITVGPTKEGSDKYAAFFGDVRGNVYSIDADTGKLIWKVPIDPQQLSRVTGGTMVYKGRLYVPVASLEEPESSSPNYICCQFRGMVAALDTETGSEIWKTYTIPDPPKKQTTPDGKTYMGPAGVGVWGPVTIDPKRNAIYFGTGNTFSAPDVGRSDAVMALDLDTGKVLWVQQDEPGDVWHTGCPQGPAPPGFAPKPQRPARPAGPGPSANYKPPVMPDSYYCPNPEGPDWDISSGVMLATLPNGRNLLVAGQKSGMVWAHDPDGKGTLVWRSDVSRGQIVFGGAVDDENAYFAFRSGGVVALRLSDGLEKWYTPVTAQDSMKTHAGFSAAVTVVPGVLFAAGLDGMIRAFNTFDGRPIWEYDTTQEVTTVNGVKAHGGSIGSAGPTVANGMLFVTSGYTGFQNGVPGNVLLAFE